MTKKKQNLCVSCKHWHSGQKDINYHEDIGISVNPDMAFNITDGRKAGILDQKNLKNRTHVTGNCAHDFEHKKSAVVPSRYSLVTNELFGCILHIKRNE